jgi:hypothetical protein
VGGHGDASKPDGTKDQHLRLTLDLPAGTLIDEMIVTNGGSNRWVTRPSGQFWPIAIYQNGRPIARAHVAQVGAFSGLQTFDLYVNTGFRIRPGSVFDLEVGVSIRGTRFTATGQCKRPDPEQNPRPVAGAQPRTRASESTEVPVNPIPAAGGASIISFQWLDQNDDRVDSGGNNLKPGGTKDEHFRIDLDLPPDTVVDQIVITGGGVLRWTSTPSMKFWPVAVFEDNTRVNRTQMPRLGRFSTGRHTFDLYVESHFTVRRDHLFGVEVNVSISNSRHSLSAVCLRR